MNPSEQGFLLEELISKAVDNFPVLSQNMRETQIKQHFQDNSLNGIDHWIKFGKNNVLIQDKWKEDTTQQEVSQFLDCATRLNRRIPRDENIYLLWVSKYGPTKNSLASLNERGVEVISCSISIEALAKLAILRIADCLGVDAVPALLSILKSPVPRPVERASVIIDEEAMEILKIRKELNEKKKREEEEFKASVIHVQELLASEPALSWKMRVSPSSSEFQYWPQASNAIGYSIFSSWDPKYIHPSEMIAAYNEIQNFRHDCLSQINSAIKKTMDIIWEDSTDEGIFQREQIQNSGGSAWDPVDFTVFLGTKYIKNIDSNYWQKLVLEEIGLPLYGVEINKWRYYCHKFLERNRNKPKLYEALTKVTELETDLQKLQKQKEILQEKINTIRTTLSI